MKVTIGTFEHHCNEDGDCGEIVDNPQNIAKKVRKYTIVKDGARIKTRGFHTREEAVEMAHKMGFEVDE